MAVDTFPAKEYAVLLPVSAVFLFLAAPLIYAGLNSMTVPKADSMDTLQDVHTRYPTIKSTQRTDEAPTTTNAAKATLPEICDLDPATLVWS